MRPQSRHSTAATTMALLTLAIAVLITGRHDGDEHPLVVAHAARKQEPSLARHTGETSRWQ